MGSDFYMPEEEHGYHTASMPMVVDHFLREFQELVHRNVYVQDTTGFQPDPLLRQQKLDDIQTCYEIKFSHISDRYFKSQPWPHPDQVYPLVEDDVFLMLYKELYFRHLYAKLGNTLSLEQRMESWENYSVLFERIFSDEDEMQSIDLPVQWLWDMVDEYVYQFQDFCRYRTKDLKKRTPQEIEALTAKPQVWDTMQVLSTLNKMVVQSEINSILQQDKVEPEAAKLHAVLNNEVGIAHVQYVLGYFSLVCMCRVHATCGDYYTALKAVEHLDFRSGVSDQVPVYMRVTSCYITLYYFMGYAYMMMRRYTDAVRTMTQVVLYLNRTQHLTRPYQYEQINKRSEQMYKLISMCVSLCPQRQLEDSVMQHLQDKYADQLARLSKGEESMYEELFGYAAPKSIYPGLPNFAEPNTREITQTLTQQFNVFLSDIRQQHKLPLIRSYLKLYTTISTAKLAAFAESMPEDHLRAHVMCLKHKTMGLLKGGGSASGSPLAGQVVSSSNVAFYVEKGVVHIADTRVAPTFVHYFTKHIEKLEAQCQELSTRSA